MQSGVHETETETRFAYLIDSNCESPRAGTALLVDFFTVVGHTRFAQSGANPTSNVTNLSRPAGRPPTSPDPRQSFDARPRLL